MNEFKRRILKCIDKGLNHLGEVVKQVIYWHLEYSFNLKRDRIPSKPEEFVRGLESMYGTGAKVIEGIIVSEFKIEGEVEDLIEAIRKAKKKPKLSRG